MLSTYINAADTAAMLSPYAKGGGVTIITSTTNSVDFDPVTCGSYNDKTVTVTGAAVGDVVSLGIVNPSSMPAAACTFTAWVSSMNTVTIRFSNFSGGLLDPNPAAGTFKITVTKF